MADNALDLSAVTALCLEVSYAAYRHVALGEPDTDEMIRWQCELSTVEDEEMGMPGVVLATATVVVVRPREWSAIDILDTDSADLSRYCALAADGSLDDAISGDLIVAERVLVGERFRGRGFGPLLVAQAITDLGADCGLAACEPAPFELEFEDPTYAAAKVRLQALWREFGFELRPDGLATIRLDTAVLEDARSRAIERIDATFCE